MELLIDTWNVLHQTGVLPPESAGIGIRGLSQLIKTSRWKQEKITMICDGTSSDEAASGPLAQLIFTGPHRSADEEIMERVANSSAPKSILVITSDREIVKSIRTRGAQHVGSADFLQALVEDSRVPKHKRTHRPTGLSKEKTEEWKQQFGIDDSTIEELQNSQPSDMFVEEVEEQTEKPATPPVQKKTTRQIKPEEPVLPDTLLEEARRLLGG